MKEKKNKLSKKIVYALAAHWDKDHRTIRQWIEKSDPMLSHPESLKIINAK